MVAAVIINPVAGHARRRVATVERVRFAERVLRARGVVGHVHVTSEAGHAFALATEEVAVGCDVVFAWGGDGTVNEVGRALLETKCALAIIPAGSGNGLARELGVPADPAGAMSWGLDSTPRPIDAGEIGGRLFFNAAGVGFDAHVAWCFAQPSARRRGLTGYVKTTAIELWRYRAEEYTIVVEGAETTTEAMIVAFANSAQYGNGARIAPGARLDDGALDMVVVGGSSPMANVWRARRLFDGSIERDPRVWRQLVKTVDVVARRPMRFHVDGEPFDGPSHLGVRVRPKALLVAARIPS